MYVYSSLGSGVMVLRKSKGSLRSVLSSCVASCNSKPSTLFLSAMTMFFGSLISRLCSSTVNSNCKVSALGKNIVQSYNMYGTDNVIWNAAFLSLICQQRCQMQLLADRL